MEGGVSSKSGKANQRRALAHVVRKMSSHWFFSTTNLASREFNSLLRKSSRFRLQPHRGEVTIPWKDSLGSLATRRSDSPGIRGLLVFLASDILSAYPFQLCRLAASTPTMFETASTRPTSIAGSLRAASASISRHASEIAPGTLAFCLAKSFAAGDENAKSSTPKGRWCEHEGWRMLKLASGPTPSRSRLS